jgi:predicted metal-dependent hydrolase
MLESLSAFKKPLGTQNMDLYIEPMGTIPLERSRRRSVAIVIYPDNRILIRAPLKASLSSITSFVDQKKDWILKKIAQNQHKRDNHPPLRFETGEQLLYLGQPFTLQCHTSSQCKFYLESQLIHLQLPEPKPSPTVLLKTLHAWYKKAAEDILLDRVDHYAPLFNKTIQKVEFRRMKSRWGSCSTTGRICFNWLLVMAPLRVIDYVVIHELAHLVHHNHSAKFWHLVEMHMPDYKTHKNWLNKHGHQLMLYTV